MKRFCILIFVMIVSGGTNLKAQSHSVVLMLRKVIRASRPYF